MKNFIFLCLLLIAQVSLSQFPAKWIGHYSGELKSTSITGKTQTYHMELVVSPLSDSTYNWTIIYGEDSLRQERKYLLTDLSNHHFVIDELNTIVLSCNLIGNEFISVFEVAGSLLHVTYTFEKNKVLFHLSSSESKMVTGGDGTDETAEIPPVISYQTTTVQFAELKRIKQ